MGLKIAILAFQENYHFINPIRKHIIIPYLPQ
jgi:hypothetical protein